MLLLCEELNESWMQRAVANQGESSDENKTVYINRPIWTKRMSHSFQSYKKGEEQPKTQIKTNKGNVGNRDVSSALIQQVELIDEAERAVMFV